VLALALVSAGLVGQVGLLVRLGAACGLIGTVSYALSAAHVVYVLRKHLSNLSQHSEK